MNILQRIFTDYYEEIKFTLHPRATEMENIDKMINCGNPAFEGAMYSKPLTKNENPSTTDWTSNEGLMDWLKSLGK